MVEALKKSISLFAAPCVLMLLSSIAITSGYAEQFRDPTRPADLQTNRQSDAPTPGPTLQSVLISQNRRLAIISGKTLKVGDRLGDAHVVSISDTQVVLQNGKIQQTLKLFPDIKKRRTSNGTDVKIDHRRQ
jgi:MSHA biogenesis protein MshK